ncbi:MAG: SMP-30/gluconolactonase/LRE family protein [Thermoleophilia bacterium]
MTAIHSAEFDVAVAPAALLGEGPRWDAATQTLLWVDIPAKLVQRYDPATGTNTTLQVADVVSLALPHGRGGVVIGLPDGLHRHDGERSTHLAAIEPEQVATRTNDGACDAAGRLWVGTMALDESSPAAGLYRVDTDLTVTTVLTGTTISNGLGWSPEDDRFYFIDSPLQRIDVFDYDRATGMVEGRRKLADVPGPGVPDGMNVDAEGCLWVALHGGWGLRRYSPDGELLAEVRLPIARITSCCFGGPALRDLYVTTRREGLSEAEKSGQPLAGALLRLDVGVAGLPTHAFAG